ncbi:MAG: DUF2807 domain-containing protein [Rubrivivax sp.]|jgi:hypothetical protein|nr:DUF2807 domain-containing protein [Rubrivivax sp.]
MLMSPSTRLVGLLAVPVLVFGLGLGLSDPASAATERRSTPTFQSIVSSGPFEVQVRQAAQIGVELDGDADVLAQIETVVEGVDGGTLQIRPRRGVRLSGPRPVVVRIAMPQLQAVALRGAGDLTVEAFQTPQLKVSIAGAGNAVMRALDTERLTLNISGSGDMRADGRARQTQLNIAGSGDAKLRGLVAEQVEVSIAGSGSAELRADKALDVSIAGSGDVRYVGNPVVKRSVVGSGTVQPLH